MTSTKDKEDSPADKVLNIIQLKLQTTRDKVEREVLKGVLLSAGLASLSNKTNRTYVSKDKK